jgi:hypothetical protein
VPKKLVFALPQFWEIALGLRGTGTCEKMQIRDFDGIGVQEFIV